MKEYDCNDCAGNGWYVLFQVRHDCETCDGTGRLQDDVTPEGADLVDDDGVPEYIEPDDTMPMFFMPAVTLDDSSSCD